MKNSLITRTFIGLLLIVTSCSRCKPGSDQVADDSNATNVASINATQIEQQKKEYATNITDCLAADVKASTESNGDYTLLTQAMRRIDLSKCPTDFATAYLDHIHAWEDAAKIQRARKELNSDENVKSTLFLSLWSDIFNTKDTPITDALEASNELRRKAAEASEKIRITFQDVEHIAVSYGGTLPAPATND